MVKFRRKESRADAPIAKVRLTPSSILLVFLGGVLLIYAILFRKATSSTFYRTDDGGSIGTSYGVGGGGSGVLSGFEKNSNGAPVIAFAVSVTGCGEDPFSEGAAVLKYSIHKQMAAGKYDYKMFAIYHPDAKECVQPLADLGYELVERETPVKTEEIEGDTLRNKIEKNGCCGSKELIKLEALTLTAYPVVVHLDLDVILLKPIDVLFDVMLDESGDVTKYRKMLGETLMWPNKTLPEKVDAFFTRDFGMVKYARKIKPVQGGFLVLRPNMTVYDELVGIVKKGDFHEKKGWIHSTKGSTGLFYGGMTIQGLFPFYYDVLQKGESVDLNRCQFNQMGDDPRAETRKDGEPGKCHTGEEECEDCRLTPVGNLVSAHFTICLKPWHCMAHTTEDISHWLCRKMHHEWFLLRSQLEQSWGRNTTGHGNFKKEMFLGFCSRHGKKGYQKISRPFLPNYEL